MTRRQAMINANCLVARKADTNNTVVRVGNAEFGVGKPVVIAGPCAIENREMLLTTARAVKEAGAEILRGGAFKPRTSPYSFQGLGKDGLEMLAETGETVGLPVVTEVMSIPQIPLVRKYADMFQVGSRNMANYQLLKALGKETNSVLLKRGMCASIEGFLLAAEYILMGGNENVILCLRGIRDIETIEGKVGRGGLRNKPDWSDIPVIKELTHLPVIFDPSHATGVSKMVAPVAIKALDKGADGVMIEVHPRREEALCDGNQALSPAEFSRFMRDIRRCS